MTKFKDKYRIESARAKWWDYNGEGSYFITICTKDRNHYFGEISNGEMHLSRTGVIADVLWREIPNRNKNVKLGEFVVMPDHIHGIIDVMAVDGDALNHGVGDVNVGDGDVGDGDVVDGDVVDGDVARLVSGRDVARNVSTENQKSRNVPTNNQKKPNFPTNNETTRNIPTNNQKPRNAPIKNHTMSKISPKSNSIAAIIRSYKSAVTRHANRLGFENGWQTRFYDSIIRNPEELRRISIYIQNNPKKWQKDSCNNHSKPMK